MTITHNTDTIATVALSANVLGGADAVGLSNDLHALCDKGVKTVVMDMSAVQIMNSSGLGMLVAALSTMRKFGGTVKFAAVPDKVMALLTMTHLHSVFELYPTTDDAIASSRASSK